MLTLPLAAPPCLLRGVEYAKGNGRTARDIPRLKPKAAIHAHASDGIGAVFGHFVPVGEAVELHDCASVIGVSSL